MACMTKSAQAAYPIHDLLSHRWSPRAFSEEPLSEATLRSLLEAARWAPSCFNAQPWHLFAALRQEPAPFAQLLQCLNEGNRPWAQAAGALVLTVARTHFAHNGKPNAHAWHDVGQATSQLTLQATALGLGVHQMAGFSAEHARAAFGIPEGFEPVAMVAVGHLGDPSSLPEPLSERERAPRQRREQSEFVFAGAWGKPRS